MDRYSRYITLIDAVNSRAVNRNLPLPRGTDLDPPIFLSAYVALGALD